jgi:hypothetical protein
MALPVPTLDHVVINARADLDIAAETFRQLGFYLTERGYHSMGSMNHLAMYGTDYLELIAVPKDRPDVRPDVAASPFGLNGIVFGTEDSTALHAALTAAGFNVKPPREFSRPVKVDGVERQAVFRTVTLSDTDAPYGRVYFCHHLTRDLVWRDEWRHHANGTVAVARAVIVHPDPAAASQIYVRMFGSEAVRQISGGRTVVVGNTLLDIVTEDTLHREFGDGAPDPVGRSAYMAALSYRTVSLARTIDVLKENGVAGVRQVGSKVIVPASSALNTALEFIE